VNQLASIRSMRALAQEWRARNLTVALVPTMGALHEGHFSLMRKAGAMADRVVVSIFVNGLQFGPKEDFARYPRNLAQDLAACRKRGVAAVFTPTERSMYAPDHSTYVVEENMSRSLCGPSRPGHFRGVATIVLKLFHIVEPHIAVFGQKDVQQAAVVRRMIRDLNCPVRLVVAPTVREADGLALSSRNAGLSVRERALAPRLWRALQMASSLGRARPCASGAVEKKMRAVIEGDDGAVAVEYIGIVDRRTLQPCSVVRRGVLVAVAAKLGQVRLIDNVVV
jgi:pantoate--beta-alanine ligase